MQRGKSIWKPKYRQSDRQADKKIWLQNKLIISNSGEALTINSNELFTRFKKNDASKDSLGLGLAIVKSICNIYQLNIDYSYSNQLHIFTLNSTKDLL